MVNRVVLMEGLVLEESGSPIHSSNELPTSSRPKMTMTASPPRPPTTKMQAAAAVVTQASPQAQVSRVEA